MDNRDKIFEVINAAHAKHVGEDETIMTLPDLWRRMATSLPDEYTNVFLQCADDLEQSLSSHPL